MPAGQGIVSGHYMYHSVDKGQSRVMICIYHVVDKG